jgi:hypothetical protein
MRFAAPRTVCSVGLALLLAGIACGGGTDPSPTPPEDPPPLATTGSVQVVLRTTGLGLDADGYAVRLDEGVPQPLAANGALTFAEVAPGNHTVRLSGAADNCAPAPPDTTVTVTAGVVSVVDRAVACHIDLRGRLLVSTEQFGLPQLVAMYPDGSQRYRLFTDGFSNAVPTVSPDGTWLLFASYRSGWWRVARFETATGAITVFPKIGDMNLQPALSPDGSQIAFTVLTFESTGEHSRIWVMGADGASPHCAHLRSTIRAFRFRADLVPRRTVDRVQPQRNALPDPSGRHRPGRGEPVFGRFLWTAGVVAGWAPDGLQRRRRHLGEGPRSQYGAAADHLPRPGRHAPLVARRHDAGLPARDSGADPGVPDPGGRDRGDQPVERLRLGGLARSGPAPVTSATRTLHRRRSPRRPLSNWHSGEAASP